MTELKCGTDRPTPAPECVSRVGDPVKPPNAVTLHACPWRDRCFAPPRRWSRRSTPVAPRLASATAPAPRPRGELLDVRAGFGVYNINEYVKHAKIKIQEQSCQEMGST